MVTPQQAKEIREFLTIELNNNGFGDIVTEVSTRLEEEYEDDNIEMTPRYLLDFFLKESIEVLENLSNSNFEEIINRLNQFVQSENSINTINVELLNAGEQDYYDLRELPNYNEIILTFREILQEVRKEN
jgi:hypothetical protein